MSSHLLINKLNVPFIPVRKIGKLPCETISYKYDLEYGSAELEIHKNDIKSQNTIFFLHENYNKALIHFEKALDLDYSDYIVHFKLGIISKFNTQYAHAEQYLLSALDIHPHYVDCLLEMTNLQIIMKNKNEAKC